MYVDYTPPERTPVVFPSKIDPRKNSRMTSLVMEIFNAMFSNTSI